MIVRRCPYCGSELEKITSDEFKCLFCGVRFIAIKIKREAEER